MYSRGVAHHASSAAAARNSHLTGGNSPRFSPVNKLTGSFPPPDNTSMLAHNHTCAKLSTCTWETSKRSAFFSLQHNLAARTIPRDKRDPTRKNIILREKTMFKHK
ncbi:hypothetical protein AC579_6215 [Pseudocercospora musae]|uniref:Uncharacterized protein n=1 Tax=Pseudocercospora musae TaxID=113226 RepID=A0A139IC38_9PEZI|nr:hypothetical protein AC579_6215 [Pseudocercospora musae]